jgi:hypothetical protein
MAKIPLNYFTRLSVPSLSSVYTSYPSVINSYTSDPNQQAQLISNGSIYEAPFERASVLISVLATNTTSSNQTIFAGLSTRGTPITTASPSLVEFATNFPIAPYDTVNIVIGKLVLNQYDNLFVRAGNDNALNLTLSILETVNTK